MVTQATQVPKLEDVRIPQPLPLRNHSDYNSQMCLESLLLPIPTNAAFILAFISSSWTTTTAFA